MILWSYVVEANEGDEDKRILLANSKEVVDNNSVRLEHFPALYLRFHPYLI